MRVQSMCVAAAVFGVAVLTVAANATFAQTVAQGTEPKATEQRPPNGEAGKEKAKKIDEYAEAERVLGGPAANPECMWLGRHVVRLLWSNDLDTAFRHLDLYDRFGCPAGHIQTAFRCVVRRGEPDRKGDPKVVQDTIEGRVNNCWINPNTDPVIAPPAAASATAPSQAQ
ncbi:MAG TPA: beta-1-3, beta-1-6-glucan biosynthesis protein [Xanthobacteraceae bacterium]